MEKKKKREEGRYIIYMHICIYLKWEYKILIKKIFFNLNQENCKDILICKSSSISLYNLQLIILTSKTSSLTREIVAISTGDRIIVDSNYFRESFSRSKKLALIALPCENY